MITIQENPQSAFVGDALNFCELKLFTHFIKTSEFA